MDREMSEAEVRRLATEGRSSRAIAATLGISHSRVRWMLGYYRAYQRVRTWPEEGA